MAISRSTHSLFPAPPTRVRWCLAFMEIPLDSRLRRWSLGWLRPGFRHVRAFREEPGVGLIVVQQTVARLQVEVLKIETEATYAAWLASEGATILVAHEQVEEEEWSLRGMTCVSVARSLLGWPALPWQWGMTPARMHARLLRRGALVYSPDE